MNVFLKEAQAFQEQLVEWRRTLHRCPELGIKLPQTIAFISQKLDEIRIPYKVYNDISCIEACIGSGERCIMLRGDIDALPIVEEADVEYKSVDGNMHGCGHDLHGTMLLGAAKLLKIHEEELEGTIKLVFQSGEEVFEGAKAVIEAGVLKAPCVEAAFAMHVLGNMPIGTLVTGKYPMSAVYGFKITIKGHGGHGAMPELCIDPINAAVQVYLALQSLVAREVAGAEEAVLTIGQFAAGEVANVIPEEAVLQGTLRTFDKNVREKMIKRIHEISNAVAAAYRCECEIEVLSDCPSVVCDDEMTNRVEKSLKRILPDALVIKDMHGMGSEDFAEYSDLVPSAYWMIGAGIENKSKWVGQHNPKVLFNEKILPIGAACYAQVAVDWINENKKGMEEN